MPNDMLFLGISLVLGFYLAWNIGANDVSNAMGTSVGSGALKMRQALVIAAVLEFCGAFFVGGHVTETIENGIIDTSFFTNSPQTLILGMLASLLSAGVWLHIASYCGWPVSTTHSIVGAIVGFGWAVGGFDAIHWDKMLSIILSWVISPLAGGILSFALFQFLKRKIFFAAKPMEAAKKVTPFLVFAVFLILSLVTLFKGLGEIQSFALHETVGLSLGISLLTAFIAHLLLRRKKPVAQGKEYASVERIFVALQIITACCMAFAHGANDVANAIGPLSAVITITQTGIASLASPTPAWILALGGIGIVIGLATYGWRVIETIGKKITELTPSRGFAAEFGAATTILLASKLGFPISTTHTLVGSVFGVGLARGFGSLNLAMVRDIILSWVITVPIGAGLSILFYSLFAWVFTP